MTRARLFSENQGLALGIARDFNLPGHEHDDVRQEARIGLWIATGLYDPKHGIPFAAWARIVIRRRLASVLQAALRGKHGPLNLSVRDVVNDDGEWVSIVDTLEGGRDPLDVVVARETLERIRVALDDLTPLELDGLQAVMAGTVSDKRVHNRAWAARKKLKAAAA